MVKGTHSGRHNVLISNLGDVFSSGKWLSTFLKGCASFFPIMKYIFIKTISRKLSQFEIPLCPTRLSSWSSSFIEPHAIHPYLGHPVDDLTRGPKTKKIHHSLSKSGKNQIIQGFHKISYRKHVKLLRSHSLLNGNRLAWRNVDPLNLGSAISIGKMVIVSIEVRGQTTFSCYVNKHTTEKGQSKFQFNMALKCYENL